MNDRLDICEILGIADLLDCAYKELKTISKHGPELSPNTQSPLRNIAELLVGVGCKVVVIQQRVHDPDFLAEYSAYYIRQFSSIPKYCTRLHFFTEPLNNKPALEYLDSAPQDSYIGFLTLRPIVKSPVGATIFRADVTSGFVCTQDIFPVNIAGVEFAIKGTPFMQQDNAVGACAQASIWMALRTLRRREGDRAHDPAQITDAATKYFVNGRVRPNRQGLTHQQMIEAIRAAGYSPHSVPLGSWYFNNLAIMPPEEMQDAFRKIHAYLESGIPVVIILFPPSGGHAVVTIGHSWDANPVEKNWVNIQLQSGLTIDFQHAVTWIPSFVIHNDNTGPYRVLSNGSPNYGLEHAAFAIPLLPVDVFVSGEEALEYSKQILVDIFSAIQKSKLKSDYELQGIANNLAIRLLLVEKRKLRKWAVAESMPAELREYLRLADFPRRVWMCEIHLAQTYGAQGTSHVASQVGMIILDPTGDLFSTSLMLIYFDYMPFDLNYGALFTSDSAQGMSNKVQQTAGNCPIKPIR